MATKEERLRKGLRESIAASMRFASEKEREAMACVIEEDLPAWLLGCFDVVTEPDIYDLASASVVRQLRDQVATNPRARSINDNGDGKLTLALKLYADFLDSKFNPAKKKPKAVKTERSASSVPPPPAFVEGAVVQSTTDRRERNKLARQECINQKGCKCVVCGFDFEAVYGAAGTGYIEVHHLKPISQTDDFHRVSVDDLVPLCANCHAMAHRRSPDPFTPEELRSMLNAQKQA